MKKIPFHPILFSVYPVIALLAHNITQVKISDAYASLAISLIAFLILFLLLRLAVKDWRRAALATSLLALFFFTYGHLYNFLETHPIFGLNLGRHRLFAPLWLALAALALWWALKKARDLETITIALNGMALILLFLPLLQLAVFEVHAKAAWSAPTHFDQEIDALQLAPGRTPPDIYYIILDAYTRDDVLKQDFKLDNKPFLNQLRELGFYVATCSQSNYGQTELSLSSSLNFNYLEALGVPVIPGSDDRSALWPLIRHSAARQALQRLGYTFVAFDSGFYRTQMDDADVYLTMQNDVLGGLNGFEVMLVDTSAGVLIQDAATLLPRFLVPDVDYPNKVHRQRILYTIDRLATLPEAIPGPKFVFVHIVAPHGPFVLGPDGEAISIPEDTDGATYARAYPGEITYLNKKIFPALESLVHNSPTPPIIIIQGDHGSGRLSPAKRMAILNAYYLPGLAQSNLYESISPVNTFRVIFNDYFGGNFRLLEDKSYFSIYQDPYSFKIVSNPRPGCGQE
jgi:hypothetical protein